MICDLPKSDTTLTRLQSFIKNSREEVVQSANLHRVIMR